MSLLSTAWYNSLKYHAGHVAKDIIVNICDRLQENLAQHSVRKYREKIDWFLKNVLFQADWREQLGLL